MARYAYHNAVEDMEEEARCLFRQNKRGADIKLEALMMLGKKELDKAIKRHRGICRSAVHDVLEILIAHVENNHVNGNGNMSHIAMSTYRAGHRGNNRFSGSFRS